MATETQALVVQPQRELLPDRHVLADLMKVAQYVVGTPYVPNTINSEAAAFATMIKGRELGIPAMASFAGIYIVHGRPSLTSELMLALIYRDHGDMAMRIITSDDTICTIEYKRRQWPSANTFSFSIEDARKAGLLSDNSNKSGPSNQNWIKRPAAMLRARCISAIARMAFPDSIGGLYTVEEMEDVAAHDGDADLPSQAQQIVQQGISPVPAALEIAEAIKAKTTHPSTGVVVGSVQPNDDSPPSPKKRYYTDPSTGEMFPAPSLVAQALYRALCQQAEAESMVPIDPADLPTADDMNGAINNVIANLAALTTEDDGKPSAEELKELTTLFRAYDGAGVKLLLPGGETPTAGVTRWLISTLTAVRAEYAKKRSSKPAPDAAVA